MTMPRYVLYSTIETETVIIHTVKALLHNFVYSVYYYKYARMYA